MRRTLSVRLSVRPSVRPVIVFVYFFTVEPSYERTSKIEKLLFSLMGQRYVCTFRHAQRAAYRTAKAKPIPVHVCFPRRGARRPVRRSRVLTMCTDAEHLTSRGYSDDSDIQVIALTKPKQPEIHNFVEIPTAVNTRSGLPRRSFL